MKPSDWPRLPTEIGAMAGPVRIGRPVQLPDDEGRRRVEAFIKGEE